MNIVQNWYEELKRLVPSPERPARKRGKEPDFRGSDATLRSGFATLVATGSTL